MAKMNWTPFGDKSSTMMTLDMQSQYVVFMRYYREVLLGNQSAIYTGAKVFGGDFMSIFSYYLASPFNLFLVFFSSADIPAFFAVTCLLKMSFAGLFTYLTFRFTTGKDNPLHLVPAIGYALISYSFIYMYDFMWLDGVMILPLVVLGLNKLEQAKCRWIYPIAIGYALMTSWYIGAMICIFAVVYFIYKSFSKHRDSKDLLTFSARFAIFSLIGGLIAAPFWLTAFMHLNGTKGSFAIPDNELMSISTFFGGFLENHYFTYGDIARNQGFFSMFVGTVVLVFFQLYFFNKSYTLRDRLVALILPLFYFIGMMSRSLNAIYHGGREPTWFPGRYSFILGFIVCYFAGLSLDDIKKTWKPGFAMPLLGALIVFLVTKFVPSDLDNYYTFTGFAIIIYAVSLVLAFGYSFVPQFKIKGVKEAITGLLSVTLITFSSLSSYRGAMRILKVNVESPEYQLNEVYLKDDSLSPIFDALKAYDPSIYRMEAMFNRTGSTNTINNNPLFYSYNGLNHFSSNEKKDVEDYMSKIGFQYNYFFEKYDGGNTASINSLFGFKYLIDYDELHEYGNSPIFFTNYPWVESSLTSDIEGVKYYENTLALPYCFAINHSDVTYVSEGSKIGDHVSWYDHFQYQNEMFKGLTDKVKDSGNKKEIFHKLETSIVSQSDGIIITTNEDGIKHITGKAGDRIKFSFEVPTDGFGKNLYFGEKNFSECYSYAIDGRAMINNTYWHKGIRGFNDTIDHKHTFTVTLKEDLKNRELWEEFYYEDTEVLKEYVEEARKQSSSDLKVKKSLTSYGFEGHFELLEDNKDLLFTVPNERNWSVYVDGKKVPTQTRYNIFLSADLSHVEKGSHTIKAIYRDNGLIISCVISSIATASAVAMFVVHKTLENKRKTENSLQ
ncbi:MAG: YfhO family protein [Bacilli bacterium]|nr:YfhO family protein [Bacilli bacterium]